MKYEVDWFVPGKRVPSCQLYIKWNGQQEQSDELLYSIKLVGAKEPFNFFLIHSPASTPLLGTCLHVWVYILASRSYIGPVISHRNVSA